MLGLDVPSDELIVDIRRRDNLAAAPDFAGNRPADRNAVDASKSGVMERERTCEVPGAPAPQTTEQTRGAGRQPCSARGAAGALKKDTQTKINNIHTDSFHRVTSRSFLAKIRARASPLSCSLVRSSDRITSSGSIFRRRSRTCCYSLAALQPAVERADPGDQSIPSSLKFRVWGNLSPRQLPEALNVLAPTLSAVALIGNMVFVVARAEFPDLVRRSWIAAKRLSCSIAW